jgi:beta-glucosidase
MARMTVDEKIGQLNLPTSGDITTGRNNNVS